MLSDAEVSQFKREGYLIKRPIIDQDYCATARERIWDDPAPSMKKEEPESWVGPFKSEEEPDDPQNFKSAFLAHDNPRIRRLVQDLPLYASGHLLTRRGASSN